MACEDKYIAHYADKILVCCQDNFGRQDGCVQILVLVAEHPGTSQYLGDWYFQQFNCLKSYLIPINWGARNIWHQFASNCMDKHWEMMKENFSTRETQEEWLSLFLAKFGETLSSAFCILRGLDIKCQTVAIVIRLLFSELRCQKRLRVMHFKWICFKIQLTKL